MGKVDTKEYPDSISTINGQALKNTDVFRYLGALLEQGNSSTGDAEVNARITAGTCKFYELITFFKNRKIHLSTRVRFLESLVRSRMVYGCACWTLTKRQTEKINAAYTQFLRHMVKAGNQKQAQQTQYTRKDGSEHHFSKYLLTNDEVIKRSGAKSLTSFIQEQQQNWIGHCARASVDEYIKTLTFHSFYKNEKQTSGVLDSTYRQVVNRAKTDGVTQKQLHEKMVTKFRRSTDPTTMFEAAEA